jgi:hypothetical protein
LLVPLHRDTRVLPSPQSVISNRSIHRRLGARRRKGHWEKLQSIGTEVAEETRLRRERLVGRLETRANNGLGSSKKIRYYCVGRPIRTLRCRQQEHNLLSSKDSSFVPPQRYTSFASSVWISPMILGFRLPEPGNSRYRMLSDAPPLLASDQIPGRQPAQLNPHLGFQHPRRSRRTICRSGDS